jgi:hypothetical protein
MAFTGRPTLDEPEPRRGIGHHFDQLLCRQRLDAAQNLGHTSITATSRPNDSQRG